MPVLNNLSVKLKLWLALGLNSFLLLLLAAVAYSSAGNVESTIERNIANTLPSVTLALELSRNIEASVASIGLYLKSQDPAQRTSLEQKIEHLQQSSDQLRETIDRLPDAGNLREALDRLQQNTARLQTQKRALLALIDDPKKNTPALGIATDVLNPIETRTDENIGVLLSSEDATRAAIEEEILMIQAAAAYDTSASSSAFDVDAPMTQLNERWKFVSLFQQLRLHWSNTVNNTRGFIAFRDPELHQAASDSLASITPLLDKLRAEQGMLAETQIAAVDTIGNDIAAYAQALQELLSVHGSEQAFQDVLFVRQQLSPLATEMSDDINQLVTQLKQGMDNAQITLGDELAGTRSTILWLALGGSALGMALMLLINHAITSRLEAVTSAMQKISERGDLEMRLNDSGQDEMSSLARAFNQFVSGIQDLVGRVVCASTNLSSESHKLRASADRNTQLISSQQQHLNHIVAAVNDVSSSSRQVSEHAGQAAEATTQANADAREGHREVSAVRDAVQALANDVGSAGEVIQRVAADSEKIGDVLSVIRSISEQTNLLALNAAIEAARAGEHGRGFAVVADEVRSLSESIHSETDHIQSIISSLQESSHVASQAMQRGTERNQSVLQLANDAGERLSAIARSIETANQMNGDIAELTDTQTRHIDDIQNQIDTINSDANEAAHTAEETAGSAQHFGSMSDTLQQLVQRFESGDCQTQES